MLELEKKTFKTIKDLYTSYYYAADHDQKS